MGNCSSPKPSLAELRLGVMSNGHDAIVSRFGLITAAISAPTAVGQISKVSDVEEQEESGDEDEPLKFRELKDRLTLLTMLRRTGCSSR